MVCVVCLIVCILFCFFLLIGLFFFLGVYESFVLFWGDVCNGVGLLVLVGGFGYWSFVWWLCLLRVFVVLWCLFRCVLSMWCLFFVIFFWLAL